MRYEKQGHVHFAIQTAEQLQNFALRDRIQRAGGLIGDQQPRLVQHRHCDQHALRLSHAQLPRIAPQERFIGGQADAFEQFQRPVFPFL